MAGWDGRMGFFCKNDYSRFWGCVFLVLSGEGWKSDHGRVSWWTWVSTRSDEDGGGVGIYSGYEWSSVFFWHIELFLPNLPLSELLIELWRINNFVFCKQNLILLEWLSVRNLLLFDKQVIMWTCSLVFSMNFGREDSYLSILRIRK